MTDFFVILDLQISHVPQYTSDFQIIETSNSNILNQTPDFMDNFFLIEQHNTLPQITVLLFEALFFNKMNNDI